MHHDSGSPQFLNFQNALTSKPVLSDTAAKKMRWTKPPVISIHYLSTAIFLALKWSSNFSNVKRLEGLLRQNAGPHFPEFLIH